MNKSTAMYTFWLFTLLMIAPVAQGQVTGVQAQVDKNPAMADESIVLTVTANGDADRDAFDPSSLSADFVVGRTSISSQTRMVNFDTTRTTTWTTILIPRKQGKFTLGPFNIAGQTTQPIEMLIIAPLANAADKPRDVFVTASVDKSQVYLQQQLTYTVKIHLSANLQRGSLQAPALQNAVIKPLGEDKEYSDIVDGFRYRIIERTFAVIPQKSGTFEIAGPLFEGEILDNSRQRFAYFNQSKPVNRVAPDVTVTVLPVEPSFDGHWLPSEMVQINEQWQPVDEFKVGEPVTRTLTLTALGLVEEQMPEIERHYPPDFKVYPDQASTTTVVKDKDLIAQRVENIAVIPTRAGQYVLPQVSVPWFNTKTHKTEYATIPARSIEVVANPLGQTATTSSPTDSPLQAVNLDAPGITEPDNRQADIQIKTIAHWWSISSWVLLVLWIVTLVLWRTSRAQSGKVNRHTSQSPQHDATEKLLWRQLKQDLASHEANRIYPSLQRWSACVCAGDTASCGVSSVFEVPQIKHEIDEMFAKRYTDNDHNWHSNILQQHLTTLRNELKSKSSQSELAPLFKK